jgi:hypothetical protein
MVTQRLVFTPEEYNGKLNELLGKVPARGDEARIERKHSVLWLLEANALQDLWMAGYVSIRWLPDVPGYSYQRQ